jgi:hypothetical protein
VKNLVITRPDLTLTLPPAGLRLEDARRADRAGAARTRPVEFTPKAEAERGQVRIFSGADAFKTDFERRVRPRARRTSSARVAAEALTPRPVDSGHLRARQQVFDTYLPKSFQLGSRRSERLPLVADALANDFVAEIVTGRYGPLTYARATSDPEDISFFDRRRHRNIAVYPSEEKLTTRGRFFSEDEKLDYDITRYEIEMSFAPDRLWIDGTAKLSIHTRSPYFSTLTLRLATRSSCAASPRRSSAGSCTCGSSARTTCSWDFRRPSCPTPTSISVITYSGRLAPQGFDREAVAVQQDRIQEDPISIPIEPQFLTAIAATGTRRPRRPTTPPRS